MKARKAGNPSGTIVKKGAGIRKAERNSSRKNAPRNVPQCGWGKQKQNTVEVTKNVFKTEKGRKTRRRKMSEIDSHGRGTP